MVIMANPPIKLYGRGALSIIVRVWADEATAKFESFPLRQGQTSKKKFQVIFATFLLLNIIQSLLIFIIQFIHALQMKSRYT